MKHKAVVESERFESARYDDCLIKSDQGWLHSYHGEVMVLNPTKEFAKTLMKATKRYYSPDEIKAMGMRWVTINGARVLLQGSGDGWVVVGGAGGKLNHFKVDRISSASEYAKRQKERKAEREKKERATMTAEEYEQRKLERKAQEKAKWEARSQAKQEYVSQLESAVGKSLKEMITPEERASIEERAKKLASRIEVPGRRTHTSQDMLGEFRESGDGEPSGEGREREAQGRVSHKKQFEYRDPHPDDIEKAKARLMKSAMRRKMKELEHEAMRVLSAHFNGEDDPGAVADVDRLAGLMDSDTAADILRAKKQYKEIVKQASAVAEDDELKVGTTFAGDTEYTDEQIRDEVQQSIETAKNINFYTEINAHEDRVSKYIHNGASRAMNGIMSDVYGSGAAFDEDLVRELGVEPIARAIAYKLESDGKNKTVLKALIEHSKNIREKTVDSAMKAAQDAYGERDKLMEAASGEEAVFSKCSANGFAIRWYTMAYNELGSAAGSLRAMAHIINALEDPPSDVIHMEMGRDQGKAMAKLKRAGLNREQYTLRMQQNGTFVAELPAHEITPFFEKNQAQVRHEAAMDAIKRHDMNTGELAPGMKEGNKWGFNPTTKQVDHKIAASQEAGYRYAVQKKKSLLDFKAGSGKTFITANIVGDAVTNRGAKKIMIAVPATLRDQTKEQLEQFLDPEIAKNVKDVSNLSPRERRAAYHDDGIFVVSHTALQNDAADLMSQQWDGIVADEVHQLINAKTGTDDSKSFTALAAMAERTENVTAMTGTPIKTDKREIWKVARLIGEEDSLGRMADFEKRHKDINQTTSAFDNSEKEAFRREAASFAYSQDYSLQVNKTERDVDVKMTKAQKRAQREAMQKYEKEQKDYAEAVAGYKERGERIPMELRRQRPNSGLRDSHLWRAAYMSGGRENPVYKTVVSEARKYIDNGEKGLIFFSQGPSREASEQYARQINQDMGAEVAAHINSGVKPAKVEKLKARINDPDDPLKILVGTDSLATGHNLQGASFVVKVDPNISSAQADQQNARSYRNGQDKDVSIINIRSNDPNSINKRYNLRKKGRESDLMGNPSHIAARAESGFGSILAGLERELAKEGVTV